MAGSEARRSCGRDQWAARGCSGAAGVELAAGTLHGHLGDAPEAANDAHCCAAALGRSLALPSHPVCSP
eukprot:1332070-Alexandrium_andersonii.AAC.1